MKYKTKPIIVEARQFTLEAATEMLEFENWCSGNIRGVGLPAKDRVVEVHNRYTYYMGVSSVGDWVVKYDDHFEVVADKDFKRLYEVVE